MVYKYVYVYPSVYLSICLSVYLSVYPSIYFSIYLSLSLCDMIFMHMYLPYNKQTPTFVAQKKDSTSTKHPQRVLLHRQRAQEAP